ncbi:MAG: PAS domain S-box protein, partial [Methylococcales bacterium]|nr:PAS domain S-box protein [Methylococcales bacterium]
MYTSFFLQRLDLIFFFYGLAFLVLAAVCSVLRRVSRKQSWLWLGLFGLTHGINEWLDMIALSLDDSLTFKWFRLTMMAISFLFLLEFGRGSLIKMTGNNSKSLCIYPILISVCIATAYWGNLSDVNAMVRYTFGLGGGLCATAWILFSLKSGRNSRYATAALMVGYALAAGIVVPKASFFPATLLNQEVFLAWTGIPIQLIRGTLALLIAAQIWFYYCQYNPQTDSLDDESQTTYSRFSHTMLLIVTIIVIGDFLANFFGEIADKKIHTEIEIQAKTAAVVINTSQIATLNGTPADFNQSDYQKKLWQQIKAMTNGSSRPHSIHILLSQGEKIIYAATSSPFYDDNPKPGTEYERPSVELRQAFVNGQMFVSKPYHEATETFISSFIPILDSRTQQPLAVLVIDLNIDEFGQIKGLYRLNGIILVLPIALLALLFFEFRDSEFNRQKAENTLQSSEIKFRTIYDSNCDAVMMLDEKGFFDCNEAALRLFGCQTREQFCSCHPADFSPQEQSCGTGSIILANQRIATALEKGSLRFEWIHKRFDTGITFPAEVLLNAMILDDKKVLHASVHDISERKQIEQALRESEARYARAINSSNEGIWEWIPATGEDYLSPRGKQLLGYEDYELPNVVGSFLDNIHSEDKARALKAIRRHLKNHQPYGIELRIRCKNGEYRWFYIRGQAECDEHSQPLRMSGFISDITEHKRNDMILSLQARRAETILKLPTLAEPWNEVLFLQSGQELAEDLTGSQIAFIHFINDDEESIELVAWSRRTLEHYCHAAYDKHYPVNQAGIWVDALRQHRPVVVNDYSACTNKHGLPEGHAKLTRFISVPVIENDKVVMLAAVGEKNTPYDDLDVETVQLIANEIWRIVQHRRSQMKAARFSRVLEHSLNEIYLFDCQTLKFIDVNLGARLNLGYSLEELQQMECSDIKLGIDPELFNALTGSLHSGTERQVQFEAIHRRKDGSTYPVEVRLELTDDNPPMFVAIAQDISERKKAETAIRGSEALYRAISQSINEAVITSDNWRKIIKWYKGAEKLFGYTETEIIN